MATGHTFWMDLAFYCFSDCLILRTSGDYAHNREYNYNKKHSRADCTIRVDTWWKSVQLVSKV